VLYFDSSALIKHYVDEMGSETIEHKLRDEEKASRPVFTSVLTFAEIEAALSRRAKDNSLAPREYVRARTKFESDWVLGLSPIDLRPGVLAIVRGVVDQFVLKGADVVHLASAIWLRDMTGMNVKEAVSFLSSDKKLAKAAVKSGFEVFNPETGN
jgi:predicted nucleic acid-binding protein